MDPAPYRRPYWNTQPEYLFPKYASTVKRAPTQPLVMLPHTLSEVTAPVSGVIVYVCSVPSMKKGNTVAYVGEIAAGP